MLTQAGAITLIRQFVNELSGLGISLESSWLFGSYAKGHPTDYSDIDVALVSKRFGGIRFQDRNLLTPLLIRYVDLEPHPFNPDDFNDSQPFAREIKRTGIRIS